MKATADEMKKAYQRYNNILDSIPDYITNNLREMPANKGYIWKHVHLYGLCAAEKPYSKTVLFEKLPRQVTRIHEWSNNLYRVYRKEGREVKTLESSEQRSKKKIKKFELSTGETAFPALCDDNNSSKASKPSKPSKPSPSANLWKEFNPNQPKKEAEKSETLHKHPLHGLTMLRR